MKFPGECERRISRHQPIARRGVQAFPLRPESSCFVRLNVRAKKPIGEQLGAFRRVEEILISETAVSRASKSISDREPDGRGGGGWGMGERESRYMPYAPPMHAARTQPSLLIGFSRGHFCSTPGGPNGRRAPEASGSFCYPLSPRLPPPRRLFHCRGPCAPVPLSHCSPRCPCLAGDPPAELTRPYLLPAVVDSYKVSASRFLFILR
jgi:hypothetical protein